MRIAAIVLTLIASAAWAAPQPIRDTPYDWRCVNPDGTATNHQRQDTAIFACQSRAEANPGQTYYIEGGRYRVTVAGTPSPTPPDIEYTSTTPSGDSIHPGLPVGTPVRVWVLLGSGVLVNTNGSVSAADRPYSISWAYQSGGNWINQEQITWQ